MEQRKTFKGYDDMPEGTNGHDVAILHVCRWMVGYM